MLTESSPAPRNHGARALFVALRTTRSQTLRLPMQRTPYIDMTAGIAAAVFTVLLLAATMAGRAYINDVRDLRAAELRADEAAQAERQAEEWLAATRAEADSLRRVACLRHPSTMWLARAIMSESDRYHEKELVAWVVRNRVEAEFRGRSTYREVVLDPKQFSAFNRSSGLRSYYMTLDLSDARGDTDRAERWADALEIADRVRRADGTRPLIEVAEDSTMRMPRTTFYFYSQISMPGNGHAPWAHRFERVPVMGVNAYRFRFFKDDECRGCGYVFSPERRSQQTRNSQAERPVEQPLGM